MEYPMHIGGKPVTSAERRPVRLPYDGSEVGATYQATSEQVDAAIAAAAAAAPIMREMTADERSTILRKAYQALLDDRDEMTMAVSSETGKPIKVARFEVERSALTLLFSADEAHRLRGEVVPMGPRGGCVSGRQRVLGHDRARAALRIAAVIPFNFPLNLAMHKIIGKVNDSEHGLQAGIYSRYIYKDFNAAKRVHVGSFVINEILQYRVDQMPYGGVRLSGSRREGPKYAIEEMTEPKLICWKA